MSDCVSTLSKGSVKVDLDVVDEVDATRAAPHHSTRVLNWAVAGDVATKPRR
jgi:hypothetical protein